MGRPSLAEPRRRQIVDALRTTILKHGLGHASVQRIAAEAGVPAGLIHHYFESKEDLLIATVDLIVDELKTPLKAELDVLDPERAFGRALDFLFLEIPTERMRSVLFAEIGTAALRRPQLRRRIAALNAEIVTELTALIDHLPDRRTRHADNAELAMLIACLFAGADAQLLFDAHAMDPRHMRRLADELVARFRGETDGKAHARSTPDARRLRGDRTRRRSADRRPARAR